MKIELDNIWLNWSEIAQISRERKIIFFGRGEWMEKTRNYIYKDGKYVVDNNKYEWMQTESGLKIYNPNKLKTENYNKIFIIITTTGFQEVVKQLYDFGLKPGKHFCITPSLKSFKTISNIKNHKQIIYLTCSDNYLKNANLTGGGLYKYNTETNKIKKIINGLCHGIVEGNNCIYLVDDTVGIKILDKKFKQLDFFKLPSKSRPHGIGYCSSRNLIFISFSGFDKIGVYDAENYRQIGTIPISNKYEKLSIPQHHVNDICVFQNSLYVSMFSLSGNWKLGVYDGGILEIDIDTDERHAVVSNLWMPHTPIIINGSLCYCDSMRGNIHTTTWKTMTGFNGFVRGIAYDNKYYYIGQSMHRYIDRRKDTTNNISLDTGIFMVDPNSKATNFFAISQLADISNIYIPSWDKL